ncbi:MAG: translocation/assembly module TamB domain-containing protein [Candidatus Zixiibacteriota bacterium]
MKIRRWIKVSLIAALSLAVLFAGGYLYLFKLGGIERIINAKLDAVVGQKYNLDVSVGKVKGSFLSGLLVEDVTVYYDDASRRYQLLHIPRLVTSYALANLWDSKFIFDYLTVDSAELVLLRDTSGHWIIPNFSPKNTAAAKPPNLAPPFSIGRLSLNSLTVKLIKPDDTLTFDDIFISLALKGEEDTYSVDVEQFEFTSNRQKLGLDAAGGKVTFADNKLLFKDIVFIFGDLRIRIDGNMNFENVPSGVVSFAADNVNLADVATFIGPKLKGTVDVNGTVEFAGDDLRGSVDIGGQFLFMSLDNLFVDFSLADKFLQFDTLYGTIFGDCGIDGNGYIDFNGPVETYNLQADIRQFNLNNLIANTFESDLNGHIIMYGESFKRADLVLDLRTRLYESSFDDYPIQRGSGDMVITTDSIIFLDSFRVDYFENIFYANGKVEYSGDMDLAVTADLKNLDRYKGKLFIDQPGGRGRAEATLTGNTSDPDLKGYFMSDSVWIYGLFSDSLFAAVDIERFLSRKLGSVDIDFYRGTVYDMPFDTGYALIRIDSNLVFFDTASINNPYTRLYSMGLYDYEAQPGLMTVDTLILDLFGQRFYNRAGMQVQVDSLGFNILQAAIGNNGAWLSANGRANYDETMDLQLLLNDIPMKPWKNLFAESLMVDGLLSCEASITGSVMQPEFILNAQTDSLVYEDLLLGDVATSLVYGDRLLNIVNFQLLSGYGDYRAEGSFYVDLAFTADSLERFPNLPMNISIAAVDSRFDLVTLLQPSVEQLEGDFFADFVLSGTPLNPHLEGGAFMVDARLKYFDLEDWLRSDSVGVRMNDNRIIIDGMEAYVMDNEEKKSVFAEGTITVKSLDSLYYDLDVVIPEEFTFRYELDDIEGSFEGKLHVEGDSPPLVTGNIQLLSMNYLVDFAEPDQGSPIMTALSGQNTWNLAVDINIISNYWIKNEDIDAEFAGEITMLRESGIYSFIGEMEILRGRGFLFDKTFTIEPGSRVVFEGGDTFNPSLDITAYTRVAGSRGGAEEQNQVEQLELGIHVTGTLEEPEINPTEDSDVNSREDILPLLVANVYSGEAGATASGGIERRMTDLLSAQVSRIGSRQLRHLGVETFEIDPSYSGELDPLDTRVTLGFYTSPNLYLYGRSALSGQSRQEVGFEYRFNRSVLLEGLRDEDELYHMNLKLYWEF